MTRNGIIFQYFEWHMEDLENNLWIRLKEDAGHLKDIGITSVWIPPVFKASSPDDTGYGTYDLYDLGEFDQKGSVKTKYGSKEELLEAIRVLHDNGIHVYADVILNHKANGDEKETFMAREMDPSDRTKAISESYEIEAWTKFTFPGRGDQYSAIKWNWTHFSGTDFNARDSKRAVYMIDGINKGWSQGVTYENGKSGNQYDMSKIFEGTLVQEHPDFAVTFVDNHDSQPNQSLQSWVEEWFKPLAYALILLRQDGYPKIFYGDYYDIKASESISGQKAIIDKLLYLRTRHAFGKEVDYFDHNNIIGWVRMGDEVHPYGCAVVMSNSEGGEKQMNIGSSNQGEVYADYTGNRTDKVTIDKDGNGVFPCNGGQVSVWVKDQIASDDAFNEEKIDRSV